MYIFYNSDNDNIDVEVSCSTINLLCNRNNVNIILDPMAAIEKMGTQKQRRTMFRNA